MGFLQLCRCRGLVLETLGLGPAPNHGQLSFTK